MHCRINRQRAWVARILLEAAFSSRTAFVTLTYDDEHVPFSDVGQVLYDRDLTLWLKRFRKARGPFRYFAVGEYGSKTFRPHYHAVLFGVCPTEEPVIERTWGAGFVSVSELTKARAYYCAHYTTKKMTGHDDPRLKGRPPEFARMSRNKALGHAGVQYLSELHHGKAGATVLAESGDVAREVRIDGKRYPLDQTMLKHIREYLDVPQLARERMQRERESLPELSEAEKLRLRNAEEIRYRRQGSHGTL